MDNNLFVDMTKLAKYAIAVVVLFAVCMVIVFYSSSKGKALPRQISLALARLPSITPGMKEGQVFTFLGFIKPDDVLDSFTEGRTATTWTRYDIGFGKNFVLECEAYNSVASLRSGIFDYDDGLLFLVRIRRLKSDDGNQQTYETLEPVWKEKADVGIGGERQKISR